MITMEKLNEFGANTAEGLARCFGNEALYLQLVNMLPGEKSFAALEQATADGDLTAAFEAAHALKGVTGNLALTPLFDPIQEITELLRAETDMDYTALMNQIREAKVALQQLTDEA